MPSILCAFLQKPETRETVGEYYAAMKRLSNQRALEAMIPERDEVLRGLLVGGMHTFVNTVLLLVPFADASVAVLVLEHVL